MEGYSIFLFAFAIVLTVLRDLIPKKFFFSIAFTLITVSGIISYPWENGFSMWELFVAFGGSTTLALAFLALLGYLDYIKQAEDIKIYLELIDDKNNSVKKVDTKVTVERKDCTRNEVQGLLGNLADVDRYKVSYVKGIDFLQDLHKIQNNKSDILVIPIKKDTEAYQFNSILGTDYSKPEEENENKTKNTQE